MRFQEMTNISRSASIEKLKVRSCFCCRNVVLTLNPSFQIMRCSLIQLLLESLYCLARYMSSASTRNTLTPQLQPKPSDWSRFAQKMQNSVAILFTNAILSTLILSKMRRISWSYLTNLSWRRLPITPSSSTEVSSIQSRKGLAQ